MHFALLLRLCDTEEAHKSSYELVLIDFIFSILIKVLEDLYKCLLLAIVHFLSYCFYSAHSF
jgi:hypothetical protein